MARGQPDYWSAIFCNLPTLGEGQVAWFQSENAVVALESNEDLINYVVPDSYELHICSGVVSTDFPRIQRYDLRQTPAATWISPTGYIDADSKWDDEEKAYDGDTATKATVTVVAGAWSSYLILTVNAVNIDKVKFHALNVEGEGTKIDVDIYYGDAWHDVYEGDFSDRVWVEKDVVAGTQLISKARVRFYPGTVTPYPNWELNEFQFNTAEVTPQEGIWFDTQAMLPLHPLAPYIVPPQSTFAVRLYNDDDAEHQMATFLTGFLQKIT